MQRILRLVRQKTIDWLSSFALRADSSHNPNAERRYEVEVLLTLAADTVPLDSQIIERAKEFEAVGYGAFVALHLSTAEAAAHEAELRRRGVCHAAVHGSVARGDAARRQRYRCIGRS